MQIIERTKKEEKSYNRAKAIEKYKRNLVLLKARILNQGISPDDDKTIQLHRDANGELRDYYVRNPYLQTGSSYIAVTVIREDFQNNRFIYRGLIPGADNAIGVIESNVPLSEIVASYDGNMKFQEMLSEQNAQRVRDEYYSKIGEEVKPLDGHCLYFGKPDFVLGKMKKEENGKFNFNSDTSPDIEEFLLEEREEVKKQELMRNKDSVEIDLGGGMVVAKQNCWIERGKNVNFAGINNDALYYRYEPEKVIRTEDNKYAYIGDVQIGEAKGARVNPDEPIQFVSPFIFKDVVFWADGKNLVQYFLDKKFAGLNLTLGEIFTNQKLKEAELKSDEHTFIGGITLDEFGECKKSEAIPETVKKAIEDYEEQRNGRQNNIISFDNFSK